MNKKVWIFLILALMLVPLRAFASERRGSIQLTMAYGGAPVSGGTVTLYEITDRYTDDDVQVLAEYAEYLGFPANTQTVGTDGRVTFSDLEPGYYLLAQKDSAADHRPMNPFCVSVPMNVGGELVYDIQAVPKLERLPGDKLPQTGQLIWPIWVLLGGGFGLIGLGIVVNKRK